VASVCPSLLVKEDVLPFVKATSRTVKLQVPEEMNKPQEDHNFFIKQGSHELPKERQKKLLPGQVIQGQGSLRIIQPRPTCRQSSLGKPEGRETRINQPKGQNSNFFKEREAKEMYQRLSTAFKITRVLPENNFRETVETFETFQRDLKEGFLDPTKDMKEHFDSKDRWRNYRWHKGDIEKVIEAKQKAFEEPSLSRSYLQHMPENLEDQENNWEVKKNIWNEIKLYNEEKEKSRKEAKKYAQEMDKETKKLIEESKNQRDSLKAILEIWP
jgi:hypothetical protein